MSTGERFIAQGNSGIFNVVSAFSAGYRRGKQ